MKSHRRSLVAVLISAFVIAAFVGPAGAHFRKANGKRVSKKHARMHREQREQQQSIDLAPAGLVATGVELELYKATVDGTTLQELYSEGYDVTPIRQTIDGNRVALVLSAGERTALEAKGIDLGQDQAARVATAQQDPVVFRSFDEPGGIRDEIHQVAAENPDLVRLRVLGNSIQGREYLALKVTERARQVSDGRRPAVVYVSTYHAREWISTEVNRRLLHWYIDQYRAGNPQIRDLLRTTELWFVLVHNPDGYEYTFDVERLWRKNLRDNDGDGQITNADGVDPNRNHAEHWNYDDEGSDTAFASETYRGAAANSEPETRAMIRLFDRAEPEFAISYHSFGELLLYTQGWQTLTPSADDPVYVALTGTDDNPAVPGFNPGVGADLYTTNGEFTDWAHAEEGTLAFTPELEGSGFEFEFPDDEAQIQAEFERNRQFAVNVALSARDPDDPVSHAGIDTAPMYLDVSEIDPWKTNWPSSDLKVETSYAGGSSQPVEVLAKRDLRNVELNFRINGGPTRDTNASPSRDGEVFGGNNAYDEYYRYLRGSIRDLDIGDTVEYWFTGRTGGGGGDDDDDDGGGGQTVSTEHVTFEVEGNADADVLIVAAEDRTGASADPPYTNTTSPNFLSAYTDAITAAGRTFEVYDVDMGREAPDHTGVLGHYDAVIWYTGNDVVTREFGWTGGNVSRLAVDLVLQHRAYLNESGNLMYTGQRAGFIENSGQAQFYDPVENRRCVGGTPPPPPEVQNRCLLWGDKNDFIQYYLGAFVYNPQAPTPGPLLGQYSVTGTDTPYAGGTWNVNGAGGANNQTGRASFITTSSILPRDTYPQFSSDARANYTAAGPNPFEPFDGSWYVHSQQADVSYKRLMRPFTMPASGGDMSFRISYDTEPAWDFVFVEIHNVTDDTWATAPDQNGHTTNDTGESCPAGWFELHPWLEQYQGPNCEGTGTSGDWNAHSGRSAGWEEWLIDLDAFADPGELIEISISYASDWAVQGLGAFVDSIALPGEPVESFETGLGAWTMPGSPEGSAPNPNDWIRTQSVGFEEGAIVSLTPRRTDFRTLYAGFGLEAVTGAAGPGSRADLMDRSLDFFGVR
jgi:Zinc carboxypeptidase